MSPAVPTRNVSESPHLPGGEQDQPGLLSSSTDYQASQQIKPGFLESDHLFEVAVEVNFSQDPEASWEHVARSLLLSLETLVKPQLLV